MRWYKVSALVHRDFMILKNMKYKPVEFFYLPLTTIIIWGLFSLYIQEKAVEAGLIVLVINVFWSFAQTAQSATNLSMMEDTWSGSLKHVFVSGISGTEYLAARIISSAVISAAMVAVLLGISLFVFNVQIIASHFPQVMLFALLTLVASMGLAVFVAGMILVLGKEYGFLAWSAMQAFILLSAPFYPVSIFPEAVQPVAWAMPFTNIFEGLRQLIGTGSVSASVMINGSAVAFLYFIAFIPFYSYVFRRAKRNGNLVRMGN